MRRAAARVRPGVTCQLRARGEWLANIWYRLQEHPVAAYFVLAVMVSWLIAIPLALEAQKVLAIQVPMEFPLPGATGADDRLAGAHRRDRRKSWLTDLLATLTRWRTGWRWSAVAVGSPVGLFALALAPVVACLAEGVWHRLGDVSFLGDIGAAAGAAAVDRHVRVW